MITFRATPSFSDWLDKLVDESKLENRTLLIKKTLSEHAPEVVEELDDERLEAYAETVAENIEDRIDRKIAKGKMRKATFLNYISGVALDMVQKKAQTDEIIDTLEASRPMAQRKEKEEQLDEVIKAVEQQNKDYLKKWADWYDRQA